MSASTNAQGCGAKARAPFYAGDSYSPAPHLNPPPSFGAKMQLDGKRCMIVDLNAQSVVFEGSKRECVSYIHEALAARGMSGSRFAVVQSIGTVRTTFEEVTHWTGELEAAGM